jgi:hypothetical protein
MATKSVLLGFRKLGSRNDQRLSDSVDPQSEEFTKLVGDFASKPKTAQKGGDRGAVATPFRLANDLAHFFSHGSR